MANHLLTPWAQKYWGDKDPKNFVLDEAAGYLMVPILYRHSQLWQVILWGFLLERLLDIIKPPPAWQINKAGTGAWAILMDDIVAGAYAAALLHLLRHISLILGLTGWLLS